MYLNVVQIAESFGVSENVVENWIRNDGLPHIPDRGRLLFDRVQVADWATAHGLAAQAGFLAPAIPAVAGGWQLGPLLRAGGIWRDVTPAQLIDVLAKVVAALPGATPPVRALLAQRLRAPGGVTTAPIGGGFALPHMSTRVALGRESGTVALLFLSEALSLPEPAPDGVPVTRLLFFIAPSPRAHLDLLGRLSRSLSRGALRELIVRGASDDDIFKTVAEGDATVSGNPASEGRG
jgi:PTS system nitrogen regulatory IIA component